MPTRLLKKIFNKDLDYKIERDVPVRRKEGEDAKYRALFENAHDAIVIHDLEGKVIDANPKALELFQYSKAEMLSLNIEKLHPESAINELKHQLEAIKEEGDVGLEIDLITRDGSIFKAEISASLYSINGDQYIQGIIREITTRKRLEEELKEDEKKFRELAERSFDVIFTSDANGNLTYIAPVVEEITGFSQDEVIGEHYGKFFPEEENETIAKILEKLTKGEIVKGSKVKMLKKDGSVIITEMNIIPILDNEEYKGLQGVYRDITEQEKAKEDLKRSERKFREFADSLPQVIFELDLKGKLTYVNEHILIKCGYTREEVDKGLHIQDVIYIKDVPKVLKAIAGFIRGKYKTEYKFTAKRKDGSTFPIIVYPRPIREDEKIVGIGGIAIDITEQASYEKELKKKVEELERMNKVMVGRELEMVDLKRKLKKYEGR